ncbi:MAG: nitronate monooxygenase [Pseudomonadota bacterium]
MNWPDTRLLDLLGINVPIIQAPLAATSGVEVALGAAKAGALGSLPCGPMTPKDIETAVEAFRASCAEPLNLNFFCHEVAPDDGARDAAWLARLVPYFSALGVTPPETPIKAGLAPFDDDKCALVEKLQPEIVSFHFGIPPAPLLERVKKAGCKTLCTATSIREAEYLVAQGIDAIVAQGTEAGGQRGMFLETDTFSQPSTFVLVRSIAANLDVPVIAAGGIADGAAIAACFDLGAAGVQIGTAYLLCDEAFTPPMHRDALADPKRETAVTNVMTGRPGRCIVNRIMREQGPVSLDVPHFPRGTAAIAGLRTKAEAEGLTDFSPLWSGQAASLPAPMSAEALTRWLIDDAKKAM